VSFFLYLIISCVIVAMILLMHHLKMHQVIVSSIDVVVAVACSFGVPHTQYCGTLCNDIIYLASKISYECNMFVFLQLSVTL
jgi:hypothetical protein